MEALLMDTPENLNEIIAACKKRRQEAFSRLVDMYARRLYGYFYRLTGKADVSEELLSEMFLKLVEKIDTYKDGSFERWLFTIATNVFRDHLRARRREKKFLDWKERQLLVDSQSRSGGEDYLTDSLQASLKKLDEETRELLALRYYSQLSFSQIAQMRSQPIGTLLSKVHRGIRKLRELMEE
jgi:RNA polymerase sigma-70 factor (ECF subfamily)